MSPQGTFPVPLISSSLGYFDYWQYLLLLNNFILFQVLFDEIGVFSLQNHKIFGTFSVRLNTKNHENITIISIIERKSDIICFKKEQIYCFEMQHTIKIYL